MALTLLILPLLLNPGSLVSVSCTKSGCPCHCVPTHTASALLSMHTRLLTADAWESPFWLWEMPGLSSGPAPMCQVNVLEAALAKDR